ncbi:TrgA family protein [Gymnodinialimonas hymeniacidonis]|uniref:TrgA family protein n=1 Tax=Gymnodinialimonas hymeniacidonis TaxID=3126508 RepID=UPI0034C5DEC6
MPTGSKLVGAVLFFAVGWYAALQVIPTFPEGTSMRFFPLTIALIGLVNGWMVMGARAGDGMRAAVANGLRTSLQIAFFGLLLFSLRQMFLRSADLRYSGFGEAIGDAMSQFIEYFVQSMTIEIWGVLFVGGIVGGLLTEWAARAWR